MRSRLMFCLAVLAVGGGSVADELRWKNGDVMPGVLLESGADRIRWSSPHWTEPWVLRIGSLASVEFDRPVGTPGGTWRILTCTGDYLLADLEGADDHDFHISSPILGVNRIGREAVRMMERVDSSDRIFLADSYQDWLDRGPGPILDLRYRIYALGEGWDREGEIPDFSGMEPIDEGSLSEGRIDSGVVRFDGPRAVVFEGEIDLLDVPYDIVLSSSHSRRNVSDWGRLTVGSRDLDLDRRNRRRPTLSRSTTLSGMPGRRKLRFEYIGDAADAFIYPGLRPKGAGGGPFNRPGNPYSLMTFGTEPLPGWMTGPDGKLMTTNHAALVRQVEIPESFELDLELSSSRSPRFLFGLGPTLEAGSSVDAFRLVTWEDALVVTRGDAFETMRILEEGERDVRLRLRYDGGARNLTVLSRDGIPLARWVGARIDPGPSGICLLNEGDDLMVGRVCLVRLDSVTESRGLDRDHVRLIGGEILPGNLRRDAVTGAWSVLSGEENRDLELDRVDRVVHPARKRSPVHADAALAYGRGVILKGRLLEVGRETITMATSLTEGPVVCSREGLVSLRFLSSADPERFHDSHLRTGDFDLRGKMEIGEGEEPLRWLPEGALEPQPLSSRITGLVERRPTATRGDGDSRPDRIWLPGNMSIPCRVISCDQEHAEIDAPFLGRRRIASRHLRAIELNRSPAHPILKQKEFRQLMERLPKDISRRFHDRTPLSSIIDHGDRLDLDEVGKRIEKALRIPRSRLDHPPTHLLVAWNGDVQRGDLISIDEESVRIRNLRREHDLDRDLVHLVVRITEPEKTETEGEGRIRILTRDDLQLASDGVGAEGRNLVLESPILGRCVIPLHSVQFLTLGNLQIWDDPVFSSWVVVRPADPTGNESGREICP